MAQYNLELGLEIALPVVSRHERTCSSKLSSLIQHLNWRLRKVKRNRQRLRSESLLEQFDRRRGVGATECAP
jgi:hypothetical protein